MAEHQGLAGAEGGPDGLLEHQPLNFVWDQEKNDVALVGGLADLVDRKAIGHGLVTIGVGPIADHNLHPRIPQVQGLGAPLDAIPDDRHRLAAQVFNPRILVVVHLHHGFSPVRFPP